MSTNHLMGVYNRAPLEVERGRGARLWSTDGTEYLDCVAGISTNGLGHAHPELVQAVKDQAEKLWHVSNIFRIPGQEALADALCESSFADVVFFTNSGTEAVECALKTARKYHSANGAPERIDIYGFDGSFHGRTYGAINAAANPSYTEGFGPAMQGFHQLKWGDHDAIKAAIANPTTAAIIVEPVQGEGGVIPADKDFLQGLRALCDEKNILLLFDEVQCGMGRTGAWFAFQNYNVLPDAFSLAKALAGGFPMGAIVTSPKVADVLQAGKHASTFGGGAVVCAAALATIKAIQDENLLQNVRDMGARFMKGLQALVEKYDHLKEVRGAGLMVGLVLDKPAKDLEAKLMEMGLLAIATADKVLRFLPPLNVKPGEIDEALEMIDDACAEWHGVTAEEPAPEATA